MTKKSAQCVTFEPKLPEGAAQKLRIEEAAQLARCSMRTVYRHLPYFKTYWLALPGKKHGRRLIDYEDFCAYLERRAQGPTNLTPMSET